MDTSNARASSLKDNMCRSGLRSTFPRFPSVSTILSVPLAALLIAFLISPPPAFAWKPVSHVHLAEVARLDALDGRVEFYLVDYDKGTIIRKLGDYEVEPNVFKALTAGGPYYRAGGFAADFIPDIAHSQLLIHPHWELTTSDDWLRHLWRQASGYALPPSNSDDYETALRIKAFVLGFLTHGAGDMFGHSYINVFAGGAWEINEIALRHMAFEAYIDRRTPDTTPTDFYGASVSGIEDFIYQNMLMATGLTGRADLIGRNLRFEDAAPARFFNGLIAFLQNELAAYNNKVNEYTRDYNAKIQQAKDCSPSDPRCSRILLYKEAASIFADQIAYVLVHGPIALYFTNWIKDIEVGLGAFPGPSFEAHTYAFFHKPYTYYTPPDEALRKWATDHLMSMLGLPDVVGETVGYDMVWDNVPQEWKDKLEEYKSNFYDALMESALGMKMKESEDFLSSVIDPVEFDHIPSLFRNGGCWMPMKDFNRCELMIQDTAYNNPDERYDWRKFRPAYNTVVMNKILLLSRSGLQQLVRDLGSSLDVSRTELPAILGSLNSFDEGNPEFGPAEPAGPDSKRMFLFSDLAAYKKIFMRQRGVLLPGETELPCGCPEEPQEEEEEELVLDDLVGKFSHLDLRGRLQGFSVNEDFLVTHTVPGEREQVLTVFSEPGGRKLWERKFVSIESVHPPNPTLVEDRIAVVAAETEPTSKSIGLFVLDAKTGKTLSYKRDWDVTGRIGSFIVNHEGEVLELRSAVEVYRYVPGEKAFVFKALIGDNILLEGRGGQGRAPYIFSPETRKERWLDRKFSGDEFGFVADELGFEPHRSWNDFPVLLGGRPKTRRSEPFPFYLLTEAGESRLMTPADLGIPEPDQSCGVDFCYSLNPLRKPNLVAGINTMHLRKTGGYIEVILSLDEKGKVLGREEVSLKDNLLHGSGIDDDGNLVLGLHRVRPNPSGLLVLSYTTPRLKKKYERHYERLDGKPCLITPDEIFVRGSLKRGNTWLYAITVLATKDGSVKACYPFPRKADWELVAWADNMWGIHNQKSLFLPVRSSGKEEKYRLLRIPRKYTGYPTLVSDN